MKGSAFAAVSSMVLLAQFALAQGDVDLRKLDFNVCAGAEGTSDEVMAACDREIESPKNSVENRAIMHFNRGIRWANRRDYDRAIADYSEAIKLVPTYASAYVYRADLLWHVKRDSERAMADYDEAIRVEPREAEAWRKRGVLWRSKGDYERAIGDLSEAIKRDPRESAALRSRAFTFDAKGDFASGAADFEEAIRRNPKDPMWYGAFAWRLATSRDARARDGKRAVELARKACDLASWRDWRCLEILAAAYAETGDFVQAVAWQEKTLESAEFPKARTERGKARLALYRSGRPQREGQ
jgi:tetratricopeptide (TPR) repeat protein